VAGAVKELIAAGKVKYFGLSGPGASPPQHQTATGANK